MDKEELTRREINLLEEGFELLLNKYGFDFLKDLKELRDKVFNQFSPRVSE